MAIKRRPNHSQTNIKTISPEEFIEASGRKVAATNHKIQVAVRFPKALISQIDHVAERRGMSRNALINYLCSKGIEEE